MNAESQNQLQFTRKLNPTPIVASIVVVSGVFVLGLLALLVHIPVKRDVDIGKLTFLRAFGAGAVPVFGSIALYLINALARVRKLSTIHLILDEEALRYGNFKIAWRFMREAIVCRLIGRSYVGVRTINDRAYVKKIDEALSQHVPAAILFGLHYQQWRTQCSVLIPPMEGISIEELRDTIERYQRQYGSSEKVDDN